MREKKAKWTVMVYMAGDNNLDSASLRDISEMAKVGSSRKVNILVQLDRGKDLLTRRFYITEGGGYEKDLVETFAETNTGDPKVLENFVLWAIEKYPARRYFLILWNHEGGWWENGSRQWSVVSRQKKPRNIFWMNSQPETRNSQPERSIAYDDTSRDALDNRELKEVLSRISKKIGKKIDLLGMDACLMQMVEVAYQLKDCVEIMVGSEEEEPFDGWPYDKILQVIKKRPRSWPATIAKRIVREYIKSYEKKNKNVTQSAINLRKIEKVTEKIDALAKELISFLDDAGVFRAITYSRRKSPRFFRDNYLDLYQFARNLKIRCEKESIKEKAQELISSLRPGRTKAILYQRHSGEKVKQTHGISIYFPSSWFNPAYKNLDFAKDLSWGRFLEKYLGNSSS